MLVCSKKGAGEPQRSIGSRREWKIERARKRGRGRGEKCKSQTQRRERVMESLTGDAADNRPGPYRWGCPSNSGVLWMPIASGHRRYILRPKIFPNVFNSF